ncbi:MAG: zinc-dependent metalloprotease [Fimbriimonas sp.]|nr:zinc-dependent metalloprotease [Fimbriimonas sp.]
MFHSKAVMFLAWSLAALPALGFSQTDKDKKEENDSKVASYNTAVKDLKRVDGPLPVYVRKKEVLLELPEDKLGKLFLMQVALESGVDAGFMSAGMPIGGNDVDVFKWEEHEEQVWLVRPHINYRWEDKDPFAVGAERTFPQAILGTFRIEQRNPEKHLLLVNITSLFMGDLFRLPEMVMTGLGGPYQLDREKSSVDSAKGFPENTVVEMNMHFYSPRGSQPSPLAALLGIGGENTLEDDRSAPLKVVYTMWYRKDDGYKPRLADPRVGYFDDSFFTLDKYLNNDRTQRFINRFNLIKKDPSSKLSEPVKPIVWTIDPSIPEIYRPAVKEGILRWNKAFENAGFKNAVQVQEVPKNDSDYDHADGRYNVVRMVVGPSTPFSAISLFRTDPISGEILNASITIDANVVRDLMQEHFRNQESALRPQETHALQVLTRDPARKDSDDWFLFASPEEKAQKILEQQFSRFGWHSHLCEYDSELSSESMLSWAALETVPHTISKEEYVKRFLAMCVSHEAGHCMGLRHNFAGSTNLTTAQLADDKLTSTEGISASVMDYMPPNVMAVLKGGGNFYSTTIGSYDSWAIKYGYMPIDAKTPLGERFALSQVASQSSLPGHTYMPDENVDRWDPYAVKFDGAKDPLEFSDRVMLSLRKARQYAIANMPKPGESYSTRTALILSSILKGFREARTEARFVGGIVESRNFKGDAHERPTLDPISPSVQRQAMHLIVKNFWAPDAFDLPKSVLDTLSSDENGPGWSAPLRGIIGTQQSNLLALMMSASTTDRIAENSYKSPNEYKLTEHYGAIIGAVFQEVGTGKVIQPLRRDLQRFLLNGLMLQAGAPEGAINDDVRIIANDALKRLDTRLVAQIHQPSGLDELSLLHLKDSHDMLQRFFSRNVTTSR